MIKVLKSFNSAHSAVNWMAQNRIRDTSIETTGTLKSIGMGRIPSGNYHVVLRSTYASRGGLSDGEIQRRMDELSSYSTEAEPTFSGANLRRYVIARDMGVDSLGAASLPEANRAKKEALASGADPSAASAAFIDRMGQVMDNRKKRIDLIDAAVQARNQGAAASGGDGAMRSISREDLVNIITKSVIETLALKGEMRKLVEGYEAGDPAAARALQNLNYRADNRAGRLGEEAARLTGAKTPSEAGYAAADSEGDRIKRQYKKYYLTDEDLDGGLEEEPGLPITNAEISGRLTGARESAQATRQKRLDELARAVLERTSIADSFGE